MKVRSRPRGGGVPAIVFALLLGHAAPASADPLTVTPSIGLAETFTDNVFFDDTDKADAITRLRLHVNFAYRTQSSTTDFSVGTSAAYLARTSTTSVDLAEAQRLGLSTSYAYSPRLQFTIGEHLARVGSGVRDLNYIDNPFPRGGTTTPPVDEDPGGNNPSNVNILLPSGSAFNNSLGVSATYLTAPLWTVGVSLTNGVFTGEDSTTVSQGLAFGVGHRYSETVGLNGRFGYNYFYSSGSLDSDAYSLAVGPSYDPASLWHISALVGGSLNRTIKTAALRGTADVHLDVVRILENSVISAGVRNGFTPSASIDTGTSQTLDTHLAYSRALTSWLSGTTSFTYSHFNTTSDDFDLFTLRTGLFYPIWKNITGSLNYAYRRSDGGAVRADGSGATSGVVDANILSLQITWATPLWQFDL